MTFVFFGFGSYGFSWVSTSATNSSKTALAMYRLRLAPVGRVLKSVLCFMDFRRDWTRRTFTSASSRAVQISLRITSNCYNINTGNLGQRCIPSHRWPMTLVGRGKRLLIVVLDLLIPCHTKEKGEMLTKFKR